VRSTKPPSKPARETFGRITSPARHEASARPMMSRTYGLVARGHDVRQQSLRVIIVWRSSPPFPFGPPRGSGPWRSGGRSPFNDPRNSRPAAEPDPLLDHLVGGGQRDPEHRDGIKLTERSVGALLRRIGSLPHLTCRSQGSRPIGGSFPTRPSHRGLACPRTWVPF
jgi:hypothetical protein